MCPLNRSAPAFRPTLDALPTARARGASRAQRTAVAARSSCVISGPDRGVTPTLAEPTRAPTQSP
jgi:hypothetical protein